jgi:hypothetical protein
MEAREGGRGTHTGRDHPEPGSAVVWGGGRRDDARVARRLSRQPVVGGVGQRGGTTRPGERPPGPMGPATRAKHLVKWPWPALEVGCHGAMRAWAKAGGLWGAGHQPGRWHRAGAQGAFCRLWSGHRQIRCEDQRGRGHASEVPSAGWKVLRLRAAATTMPLAVTVAPLQAHAALGTRAWVSQARAHRGEEARRHNGIFDPGLLAGAALGWLAPRGIVVVGPAQAPRAVTAEARAQAAAGEERPGGRAKPPGQSAWRPRGAASRR